MELTRQLERLHRRYFDLCESDAQRHDLRALMNRTVDHLAGEGIGWDRLKNYFEFNESLENTRCATAGVGNAMVFGVGGLLADLYAPGPLIAALDKLGVGSASKSAALGAVIGTGVLWADGVLSPSIVQGMRGPGYIPSDSLRPGSSPDAPARFSGPFDAVTRNLPPQTAATAIRQLQRSLHPYSVRNAGLIGLTPALDLLGADPTQAARAVPFAQNLLGLAAGATGALLVASDERDSGHRSPLAYLYRLPVGAQDPLVALTSAIRRVEGSSLRLEQAKQIGKDVVLGAVGASTAVMLPPVLAAKQFGGVALNDPRHGIVEKLVPPAIQSLFSPKAIIPAAVFGLGSGALSAVNREVVDPAASALTGSATAAPDDAKRNRIVASVMRDTTTFVVKDKLYKALATTAVRASQGTDAVKQAAGNCLRPSSGPVPNGVDIHAGGASVAALSQTSHRPAQDVEAGSRHSSVDSGNLFRGSFTRASRPSLDSQESVFQPRPSGGFALSGRSPQPGSRQQAPTDVASAVELRQLDPKPLRGATSSV